MIVRTIALFFALLCGLAMTQLPEFVQQYRQRLGGAIDELAASVASFDASSTRHGLTENGGIERFKASPDDMVKQQGVQIEDDIGRLGSLREAQADFRNGGQVSDLMTFAAHYDSRIARGAFKDFYPAVPVSAEALILGAIGFLFGGGATHLAARPLTSWRTRSRKTVESLA